MSGRGPFLATAERDSLMLIGSYIGVLAVTNMLLAAAAAERRQAERAMAESEKRLRAVVEDQTDLICRFKPDGTLTFVNGAYCRFHGKSRAELLGTNFLQTLPVEDLAIPLSWFEALPPEQPVVSFDHRVVGLDGLMVWQQYSVRRLFREGGQTLEFQAVIQDITHRKQTEQALRASEGKYRSLVANIPDIVWTADANRKLLYMSDSVEKILGYTAGELDPGRRNAVAGPHPSQRLSQSPARLPNAVRQRGSVRRGISHPPKGRPVDLVAQPRALHLRAGRARYAPTAFCQTSRSASGWKRRCSRPRTPPRPPTAPRASSSPA